MNALLQTLRSLGPARLAAMAGVSIFTLGFLIFMTARIATPQMDLLYGNLAPADAKKIITQLEAQKIPYKLQNGGQDILVPADQKLRLRVQTVDQVTGGASVGYEIFDKQSALGATNFVQNLNLLRALEGELGRTITSIDTIKAARVHLVLPKREMFSRIERIPSASVILRLNGRKLQPEQVQAIQNLVAAAVPKLQPNQVAITDSSGALLARANDNPQNLMMNNAEQIRRAHELQLTQAVEDLLGRTVGAGKVRAEISVDMDFNRTITNKESFDPEGSVPLSTVTVEENATTNESQPDTVSVGQNLPDATVNTPTATAGSNQSRTEETVNFNVSRTTTNQVKEVGSVRRLTIAVMVDGTYDANGKYQPRSEEELAKLTALVRNAVGFNAARGDELELVNMQFVELAGDLGPTQEPLILGIFTKSEVMRVAEGLGVAVVAILVILLVVRPLVTRAFETLPEAATAAEGRRMLTEQGEIGAPGQLTGPGGAPGMGMPEDMEGEELIDIDKVEGRVKASSLKKIGEIVDKHPEEALSIVRNWLYADSGGPAGGGGGGGGG